jgi:hypothetical protein
MFCRQKQQNIDQKLSFIVSAKELFIILQKALLNGIILGQASSDYNN